jgi:hypothetical protein
MPSRPGFDGGLFLQTTTAYDDDTIQHLDVNSEAFKQFMIKLRENIGEIYKALNLKDTGIYSPNEFVCGKTYPPNPALIPTSAKKPIKRMVTRKSFIILGGLAVGPNVYPHGINITLPAVSQWSATFIDGTACDTTNRVYYKIPHLDPAGKNICIEINNNNIVLTVLDPLGTGIGYPTFTTIYICVEFLTS